MKCDNMATVQVINSGRSHNEFLQACARELIFLACKWEFELSAVHVPGVSNKLCDWLSRCSVDVGYWDKFVSATGGSCHELVLQEDTWHFECDW